MKVRGSGKRVKPRGRKTIPDSHPLRDPRFTGLLKEELPRFRFLARPGNKVSVECSDCWMIEPILFDYLLDNMLGEQRKDPKNKVSDHQFFSYLVGNTGVKDVDLMEGVDWAQKHKCDKASRTRRDVINLAVSAFEQGVPVRALYGAPDKNLGVTNVDIADDLLDLIPD